MYNSLKLKTIETVVNTELKEVTKWLRLNKLSLNVEKTEPFFFHPPPHHKHDYSNYSIKLNGTKIEPVNSVKYLGMYIDRHLNWNNHICELSKKLSRANDILSKLRYNESLEICLQVYYAILYSHLTYGCNAWGFTSQENIRKIEILQKKVPKNNDIFCS